MTTANALVANASARPLLLPFTLPWMGHLEAEWTAPVGDGVFFDCDASTADGLPAEARLGRLRVVFHRDASARPSRLAWAALAAVLVDLAGWTEGHLWRLF